MPLRQHDIVLAEGNFKVVLTDRHRLFSVIDATETALGPMRIALEMDPRAYGRAHQLRERFRGQDHVTSGLFSDIGHAVSHVAHDMGHVEHLAEGAFDVASKAASTLARPMFDAVRDVSAQGMKLVSEHMPILPEHTRKSLEAASRIVMRARLGDLTAKGILRDVVNSVRAGVAGARAVGDSLLAGSRLVSKVLDEPFKLAGHIPGVGGLVHGLSPFQQFDNMAGAVQKGDFKALGKMLKSDISTVQGVISLFPGIGQGISAALSAGMAVLDGGGAIEIAVKTAYGAIPIPPGIRTITDAVVDGVLTLAKKGEGLTDAAIAAARDAVPSGIARDVFDTLAHLVIKRHKPAHVAGELLDHYVKTFTTSGEVGLPEAGLAEFAISARLVQPLARLTEPEPTPPSQTTALALARKE